MKGKLMWLSLCLCLCMIALSGCGQPQSAMPQERQSAEPQSQPASYRTVMEVEDWGPAITKVIVDLGQTAQKGAVDTDTFRVHVVRTEARPNTKLMGQAKGDREVTRAYISDENGNQADEGNYATLEMEIGPDVSLGSPINYSRTTSLNGWVECAYTITQRKDIPAQSGLISGLVADQPAGEIKVLLDDFTVSEGTYDGIDMKYAGYTPAQSGKRPLIIWLNGAGEGGKDGLLPIAGNKAVNFASEEIQAYFGGAYVLAPQAPTMWMDGKTGFGDGTSIYEDALMELIQAYVAAHPGIDTDRIYLGGDSNGGYMTMLLARDHTGYFAAAFPTCEALRDTLIMEQDIQTLKDLPIWFIAAKTDTTVPVDEFVVPTYNRLVAAGARDVHLSLYEKVVDQTGLYTQKDGAPYEYYGHWSWIYVYNNDPADVIDGKTVTLMEWLAGR